MAFRRQRYTQTELIRPCSTSLVLATAIPILFVSFSIFFLFRDVRLAHNKTRLEWYHIQGDLQVTKALWPTSI